MKVDLITTTSNIEGWNIERYYGIVTHQIVLGANLFKDIFASFSDLFGGQSQSYQKELEKMQNLMIEKLKEKAVRKNGNIILGLRMDFDEISGGGKSMFMLSASGTVAQGSCIKGYKASKRNVVNYQNLDYELIKDDITEQLANEKFKLDSSEKLRKIVHYKIDAIRIVVEYFQQMDSEGFSKIRELLVNYFEILPAESINNYLIEPDLCTINKNAFIWFLEILDETNWFSYEVINKLLEQEGVDSHRRAVYLADIGKYEYEENDAILMKNLAKKIKEVFSVYPIISDSKGLFGGEKQNWICPICERKNLMSLEFCSDLECYSNQYGFQEPHIDPIEFAVKLERKADKIKSLFEEQNQNRN